MFAALALPRGWKSRLEPEKIQICHFVWGSRSEWLKNNVLNFLMFQKSTIGYRGSRKVGVETSARDCLPNVTFKLFYVQIYIFVNFAVKGRVQHFCKF